MCILLRMDDTVRVYQGGSVETNGYLVEGEDGFIVIDAPAGMTDWLLERRHDAKVSDLLITHMHFDHIEDVAHMVKQFGCRVHAHSPYSEELTLAKMARKEWGMKLEIEPFVVDQLIGSELHGETWGGKHWFIHHVPGHSPDSLVYHLPEEELMFTGDVLFAGSVGRADFPGGDLVLLQKGIHERLLNQGAHTRIYPGHGPYTKLAEEALNNPYLS